MELNKKSVKLLILIIVIILVAVSSFLVLRKTNLLPLLSNLRGQTTVKLLEPAFQSKISIEEALKNRRSIREYKNEPLSMHDISQLLWAAQGVTSSNGFRTAPSAGALYPLQVYLISGNVQNLSPGIYHYQPQEQTITLLTPGDRRNELMEVANKQADVKLAAADLIITATFNKSTEKYGNLGQRFVFMEAGHAAENVLLQAVSLKIGSVPIGGFDADALKKFLHLPPEEEPLYILPLGKI